MVKNPSIIIVGAGAAGIAAATKLLENGFVNVTVLEAENRIGGRVHSVDFGGSIVDLGGQWVHGEKGNIVYEKVKDLDLLSPSHNTFDDNTYYLSDGTIVDRHVTDRLFAIATILLQDEGVGNDARPIGEYFVKAFKEIVIKDLGHHKDILKIAELFLSWFEKYFFCLYSESWSNMSSYGIHLFEESEGNQQLNWRNKGYRTILYILMKKIPDVTKQLPLDDKIFLNKDVTSIVWDANTTNYNGVTVHCLDGSQYNADHVIVTVSLGVLKKSQESLFVPELPPYKLNSIEGLGFGTVNKILLKFPKKWWPSDLKGFSLLWTDEDRNNFQKDPNLPDLLEDGWSWLESVFGFYVIDSHPRVLMAFVVGPLAPKVELLTDKIVIQGCMYLLRKFSGKKDEIPEPDEVLRSKWSSNSHFCGSYAHHDITTVNKKATAKELAKPLVTVSGKQVVLFAGEATNSTKFSTVHGAIETGYREAERLINIYKRLGGKGGRFFRLGGESRKPPGHFSIEHDVAELRARKMQVVNVCNLTKKLKKCTTKNSQQNVCCH